MRQIKKCNYVNGISSSPTGQSLYSIANNEYPVNSEIDLSDTIVIGEILLRIKQHCQKLLH